MLIQYNVTPTCEQYVHNECVLSTHEIFTNCYVGTVLSQIKTFKKNSKYIPIIYVSPILITPYYNINMKLIVHVE